MIGIFHIDIVALRHYNEHCGAAQRVLLEKKEGGKAQVFIRFISIAVHNIYVTIMVSS